ncbi:allantoate deiminase [Aerococcaceae bacterium DSM 111020]|nr:allantoate deiminase [Aerococcaceae bacterium DSM 111020]
MINIEPKYVDEMMDWISNISDAEGPGTTRLLYSKSWVEAQQALSEKFKELGMQVEFDAVGNQFATVKGTENPEVIHATGSHIDTVVEGGRLDGQLGIMAGYMALNGLIEEYGLPKQSIRIISMAEEEGSRFPYAFWGSKNIFNMAKREDVEGKTDGEGIKFEDAMRQAGFEFKTMETDGFDQMDSFIELHIEQGNFLENANKQVGVVNAIVGQKRYDVILKGQANHAGTTLMEYRHDAVECFSRIVVNGIDKAKAEGNPLVLTFGRIDAVPNVVNVVPGEASFSIDCRHTDQEVLNRFTAELEEEMTKTAEEMGLEIEINLWMDESPVPMDTKIVQLIEEVCEENELNYQLMHSGAGHDAQIFAQHVPTGMIFVPSIDGISHNPQEHTNAEDIAEGIKALAAALYKLAY